MRLPFSLSWFAVTAVIFVLQWIPYTGIFLMILAAPFWSILTVNVGFVSLAIEALSRPGMRIWLIAPLVYFGCYFCAAFLSHQEFDALDRELRAHNAGKTVAFSPAFNDLVIDGKSRDLSGAAQGLVRSYKLGVAFSEKQKAVTARHQSVRIGTSRLCAEIRKDKAARAASIHAYGIHRDRKLSKNICTITGPEDPSRSVVRVSSSKEKRESWLLPATIVTITVREPSGGVVELKSGQASTLFWFPLPTMGCALNSGAPSWDCFAQFWRGRAKPLGGDRTYGAGAAQVLAEALGLETASEQDLLASAVDQLPPGLARSIYRR